MHSRKDQPMGVARLRWQAEEVVHKQGSLLAMDRPTPSREETSRLIHELRVHQIELKMQNDELRRAHAELSAMQERYFDLYNLAPVGYFIVSHDGRILETNLAGVTLLGVPRAALVKQPVTRFIFKGDQDVYYLHRRELLATGKAHDCELRMVKPDGTAFWVRLIATTHESVASTGVGGAPVAHVVLSDIGEWKAMKHGKAGLGGPGHLPEKRPRVTSKARAKGNRIAARRGQKIDSRGQKRGHASDPRNP
jgi:PAS domain S-box-containing protein